MIHFHPGFFPFPYAIGEEEGIAPPSLPSFPVSLIRRTPSSCNDMSGVGKKEKNNNAKAKTEYK